jgi:hypothetical protein
MTTPATYNVYFELYGHKMKARIQAASEEEAIYLIIGKLKFHKLVRQDNGLPPGFNEIFQKFK